MRHLDFQITTRALRRRYINTYCIYASIYTTYDAYDASSMCWGLQQTCWFESGQPLLQGSCHFLAAYSSQYDKFAWLAAGAFVVGVFQPTNHTQTYIHMHICYACIQIRYMHKWMRIWICKSNIVSDYQNSAKRKRVRHVVRVMCIDNSNGCAHICRYVCIWRCIWTSMYKNFYFLWNLLACRLQYIRMYACTTVFITHLWVLRKIWVFRFLFITGFYFEKIFNRVVANAFSIIE